MIGDIVWYWPDAADKDHWGPGPYASIVSKIAQNGLATLGVTVPSGGTIARQDIPSSAGSGEGVWSPKGVF